MTNDAIGIYQFRDNRIVRAWLQTDRLGFLQQIGAVPEDVGVGSPLGALPQN
jgi:hypothetical protein